jgi:ethanolamine ammonia-lyase small subunit
MTREPMPAMRAKTPAVGTTRAETMLATQAMLTMTAGLMRAATTKPAVGR